MHNVSAARYEQVRAGVDRWRRALALPPLVNEGFGEELRRLRKERGVSLRYLAAASEVSPTYISKLENGLQAPPSEQTIRRMAAVLGADDYALLLVARKLPSEVVSVLLRKSPEELRELGEES